MRNELDLFSRSVNDYFDIFQWLRHVELAKHCHDRTEDKQIAMALMSLRGLALSWLDSLDLSQQHIWETLKDKLIVRFGEKPQQTIDKLYARIQQPYEDVGSYTNDFNLLLSGACCAAQSGNQIRGPMQLTVFIEELLPQLQEAVTVEEPQTLEAAIEAARYIEFHKTRLVARKGMKSSQASQAQSFQAYNPRNDQHYPLRENRPLRPPPRHSQKPQHQQQQQTQ